MKNLYVFNKNAFHARLFKWIYGVDPTVRYKSICPYFWSMVLTILFIIPILLIKLLGKTGNKILNSSHDYNRKLKEKKQKEFSEFCQKEFTPKQAYDLTCSKCWSKYNWYISYDDYDRIKDLQKIYIIEREKTNKIKQQKITQFKENKYVSYIVLGILGISIVGLLGLLYQLCGYAYINIDWISLGHGLVLTLIFCGIVGILFLIIKYIVFPLITYLSCLNLPSCRLCNYIGGFFRAIWSGILITKDMIYNTYKKNCPLITWKE